MAKAKKQNRLDEELERLGRIPLLIVDEVGYIPFDPEAASLFFALVSSRYERSSLIVSSNKTFSIWPEIFGDPSCSHRHERRKLSPQRQAERTLEGEGRN